MGNKAIFITFFNAKFIFHLFDADIDEAMNKKLSKLGVADISIDWPEKHSDKFFLMNNNDRSTFLQSLSIKDFDIESLRKKTRECIKQRKDKLTSKSTERRLLQEQCKKYGLEDNITLNEPELKLDTKGIKIEDFIKEEETKMEKFKKQVKEKRQKLENKIKEVHNQEKLIDTIISKKNLLEHFQKRLNELLQEQSTIIIPDEEEIDDLKNDIETYQNIIKLIKIKQSFKEAREEYDAMFEMESKKIKEQLEILTKNIDDCDKYVLTEEQRKLYNKDIENANKVTSLLKEIKTSELINYSDNINKLLNTIESEIEELEDVEFDTDMYNKINTIK
jgi:hypothetical protein